MMVHAARDRERHAERGEGSGDLQGQAPFSGAARAMLDSRSSHSIVSSP